MTLKVTLKDGSVKEVEKGSRLLDVAMGISEGFARTILAADVNGVVVDLSATLENDSDVNFLSFETPGGKLAF